MPSEDLDKTGPDTWGLDVTNLLSGADAYPSRNHVGNEVNAGQILHRLRCSIDDADGHLPIDVAGRSESGQR